jgi:hypothetical protein
MATGTSIGPGPERGGNEDQGNADGRGNKTLGEHDMPEPEAGAPRPGPVGSEEEGRQPPTPER